MARPKKSKDLIKVRRRKIFARRFWLALRVLLISGFFVAALWGINYFYNSSYFKIKTIDIEGNYHYNSEYIEGLLEELKGKNIFEADKKKVEDMLIEDLTWIKQVDFRKIFPDRIDLFIVERGPVIMVTYRNKHYLLDEEGIVLEDLGGDVPEAYEYLLEVTGAIDHGLEPGDLVAKKNVLSCADIYRGFDDDLKSIIKRAGIKDNVNGDIFFFTHEGIEIVIGDSRQVIKKIEVLKLLLKEDREYNIIDLRSPDNPVVKY